MNTHFTLCERRSTCLRVWPTTVVLGIVVTIAAVAVAAVCPSNAQFVEETLSGSRPQPSASRIEIEPSAVLSAERARAGLEVRQERLRERYELWLSSPAERPRGYEIPAVSPEIEAEMPAPPDAPDGEVTREW